ncbi:MAG: adenylate/guanylate cyclase domain-containing protein [Arenimonas sp.]
MTHTWSEKRAKKAIETRFEEVRSVTIVNYSREMSLENIPVNKAYRMSAAHLYLDIVNLADILRTTQFEGETCHKRALRFLNQHYRAVHRILEETDAVRVDFQNQRLHAIVPKPYGESDESSRVYQAVAIAQLISDVLNETGDEDEHIPNAKIRVGIDTGRALVVNNGRRGNRESLFLGSPANHAAKCASAGEEVGIYLTNAARAVIGLPGLTNGKERTTALTNQQIADCQTEAALNVSKDDIVKSWREEQSDTPIGSIEFSRPTPPLCELDIEQLTASNSRRFDSVSIYADIDGFTSYIDANLEDNPETLVRCLHVIRSELDRVIHTEGWPGFVRNAAT